MPGVQDDWLAILRFDTEANLQAWLDSPERQKLLQDANPFTEEFHARIVRTGFDQWFPVPAGGAAPPAVWKMNMLVLLMLYPIVFLFGFFVQTPFLTGRGLPFAIALFIGNIVSVVLLSYLVPRMAERFSWWLQPAGAHPRRIAIAGVGARGRALRRDAPGVLAAVLKHSSARGRRAAWSMRQRNTASHSSARTACSKSRSRGDKCDLLIVH